MGLDMYLYKKHYVKNWDHNNEKFEVSVKINGEDHPGINPKNVTYIQEEVGYWRKANQIHEWFVQNCQNGVDECQEAWVDRSKLEELLDICKQVKEASKLVAGQVENGYTFNEAGEKQYNYVDGEVIEDSSVAEELLPTQSGFFFGGTGYDKWYLQDIDHTIEILEKELNMKQVEGIHSPEYYYRSSW